MNEKIKKILIIFSIIIGIVAFISILSTFSFKDILESFTNLKFGYIIGFLCASIFIQSTLTIRWMIVLKYQGIRLSFWKATCYRLAGYGVSYLTPGPRVGGEPVTAALMKKERIEFKNALSGIAIDKVIETTCSGIFFVLGGIVVLMTVNLPKNAKIPLIIALLLFSLTICYFCYKLFRAEYFFSHLFRIMKLNKVFFLKKYEQNIKYFEDLLVNFYKHKKMFFIFTIILSILSWIGMYFEYQFLAQILGIQIGIDKIFLIVSFVGVAMLTPVPMALGTMEAGQIGAFAIFGVKQSSAIALSLMVRARDLIIVGIGLGVLSYYGLNIGNALKKAAGYEDIRVDVNGKQIKVKVKKYIRPDYVEIRPQKNKTEKKNY
ncbi:MAG: lysylphosphatidylglycerol synthase transmembrane domain-containing protein [Candidatus Woesearchaeota archaeon]